MKATRKQLLDALLDLNALAYDMKYLGVERALPAPVQSRLRKARATAARLLIAEEAKPK